VKDPRLELSNLSKLSSLWGPLHSCCADWDKASILCKMSATVEVIRLPQGRLIVSFYIVIQGTAIGIIRYDCIMMPDRFYLSEDGD
jgi:hypothetical protein